MSEASPAPAPAQASSSPKGLLARYWWIVGLAIAAVIAILAANFASGDPDGLDSVAINQGFEEAGKDPGFQVLPDYTIPGLDGTVSTILAGIVGIAIVFLLVFLLGRLLARRRKDAAA
jgi:cobalt/nickel transport system permease protein